MPGTRKAKYPRLLAAALLALVALSALPGCYARRSIPSDPPGARAQAAPAPLADAAPAPDPAPEPSAMPAKMDAATKVEAAPVPEPAPAPAPEPAAMPAKAEAAPAQAGQAAPAQTEKAPSEAQAPKADAAPVALREYAVQIGAFGTEKNAQGAVAWLKEKGFDSARMVRVEQGQSVLYRVRTGAFQDLASASKALETLKADWPQAFIPAD